MTGLSHRPRAHLTSVGPFQGSRFEDDHKDSVLVADLASANNEIARFILGHLDADAGRADQRGPAEELGLADRLTAVAESLRDRAARRAR